MYTCTLKEYSLNTKVRAVRSFESVRLSSGKLYATFTVIEAVAARKVINICTEQNKCYFVTIFAQTSWPVNCCQSFLTQGTDCVLITFYSSKSLQKHVLRTLLHSNISNYHSQTFQFNSLLCQIISWFWFWNFSKVWNCPNLNKRRTYWIP